VGHCPSATPSPASVTHQHTPLSPIVDYLLTRFHPL